MNRKAEIDEFLNNIKAIMQYNNMSYVSKEDIYHLLALYDCNHEDVQQSRSIAKLFDGWGDHFDDRQNIDVYISPTQKGFLQFRNSDGGGTEYIKLYLSLGSDAIEEGVIKVFDFLEENNIKHASKVSQVIRSDDIVLRIRTCEDAKKVVDFINSDEFLTQNARKTNPFLPRCGVVGYAFDNMLSYNMIASILTSQYVNLCSSNNSLDSLNADNFLSFVQEYSQKLFSDRDELLNFINSPYATRECDRILYGFDCDRPLIYFLMNVKSVMGLVQDSLSCADDFDHFISLYEDSINTETKDLMKLDFLNLLGINQQEKTEEGRVDYEGAQVLLDEFIEYAYEKYGHNTDYVIGILQGFMYENNTSYITRDNNFRQRFGEKLDLDMIISITSGDLYTYVYSRIMFTGLKSSGDFDIVYNACVATYQKYGYDQLVSAINSGWNGDYLRFTNDGNVRNELIANVSQSSFRDIVLSVLTVDEFPRGANIGQLVADDIIKMMKNSRDITRKG